jgi:hypothetical protein
VEQLVARWAQPRGQLLDTKQKGDIAEQAAILQALKFGCGVLKPVGDRLPYDLVFDVDGTLIKIQVKYAWFDGVRGNYVVDNRRTKTNRRQMLRSAYSEQDFDFAIAYIADRELFYIFPVAVFISFASEIHLVETDRRQRKPRSAAYRDAWQLIERRAAYRETGMRTSVEFGEAFSGVIPSQASETEEGVETEWQTP